MATVSPRLRRDDGQGLIELVVAMTILAVGIGAVVTVLTSSALSLQRSDQKGTALTLAETQIELYRNLSFSEVRLANSSWSSAPLTTGSDPYFTAHSSDPTIPSGAKVAEVTDTPADTTHTACATPISDHPECVPVRTVTGPDHRLYRIDTYVTNVTPTDDGTTSGNAVGLDVRQVTVVVRNAQISTLPILARNSSTFTSVNAASFGGKAIPTLTPKVPGAWVTSSSGTTIPAAQIGVAVANGLYPLNGSTPNGVIRIFAIASPTTPTFPCDTSSWTAVGSATVNAGNVTYQSDGDLTVAAGNTYWWYVTFNGDASNKATTSRCSPAMATTVVRSSKWTPSISVSAPTNATSGVQVDGSKFSAKLTNASPGATGTIHIKYVVAASAPSPCAGGTDLGTVAATGSGTYSQGNPFPATPDGTYWWYAVYDGDASNQAATSACTTSTVVGAGPSLVSMQMKDTNANGKVDQVLATFDKSLGASSCSAPCSGWTLSGVPSGGSLKSVTTTSGSAVATISLNEGTGAADTSVGTFTLALDSSSGIVDTLGRHGSFTAAAPSDAAGPVPISMSSSNMSGGTAGKAEAGDTVSVTFSEAIASIGVATTSTVTLSTTNGSGKAVKLQLTNLGNGTGFTIGNKDNYLSGGGNTSAVFGPTGSTIAASGNQVTVTLGTWNSAGSVSTGNYAVGTTSAFTPATTIKDLAGNSAAGTLTPTIRFF